MMELQQHKLWTSLGITGEFLKAKADWLKEPRELHHSSYRFFELAGTLVFHSQFEYAFASLAFFQAAIGLECSLKRHYRDENRKLSELLARAVKDQLILDSMFGDIESVSKFVLKALSKESGERTTTYSEKLALLVPQLRNEFFHGTYLLSPEYLHLTLHLRTFADALAAAGGASSGDIALVG